jgi:hypothetical protein
VLVRGLDITQSYILCIYRYLRHCDRRFLRGRRRSALLHGIVAQTSRTRRGSWRIREIRFYHWLNYPRYIRGCRRCNWRGDIPCYFSLRRSLELRPRQGRYFLFTKYRLGVRQGLCRLWQRQRPVRVLYCYSFGVRILTFLRWHKRLRHRLHHRSLHTLHLRELGNWPIGKHRLYCFGIKIERRGDARDRFWRNGFRFRSDWLIRRYSSISVYCRLRRFGVFLLLRRCFWLRRGVCAFYRTQRHAVVFWPLDGRHIRLGECFYQKRTALSAEA